MAAMKEYSMEIDEISIEEAKKTDAKEERTDAYAEESKVNDAATEDSYRPVGITAKLKAERPWLYRALRTFVQTFISVMCGQITMLGMDDFTKKALFGIATSAGAAAIAAVMNMNEGADKNG